MKTCIIVLPTWSIAFCQGVILLGMPFLCACGGLSVTLWFILWETSYVRVLFSNGFPTLDTCNCIGTVARKFPGASLKHVFLVMALGVLCCLTCCIQISVWLRHHFIQIWCTWSHQSTSGTIAQTFIDSGRSIQGFMDYTICRSSIYLFLQIIWLCYFIFYFCTDKTLHGWSFPGILAITVDAFFQSD